MNEFLHIWLNPSHLRLHSLIWLTCSLQLLLHRIYLLICPLCLLLMLSHFLNLRCHMGGNSACTRLYFHDSFSESALFTEHPVWHDCSITAVEYSSYLMSAALFCVPMVCSTRLLKTPHVPELGGEITGPDVGNDIDNDNTRQASEPRWKNEAGYEL